MAQREIGLAAGEPPTAKAIHPQCWNKLARLVERAGNFSQGSITAFYTVLMEGDDQQDPVVDTVRSLLDGHVASRPQPGISQSLSADIDIGKRQPVNDRHGFRAASCESNFYSLADGCLSNDPRT